MQHPRTLVSNPPRDRRIWPWLVLLLLVSIGGSFVGVWWFTHRHSVLPGTTSPSAVPIVLTASVPAASSSETHVAAPSTSSSVAAHTAATHVGTAAPGSSTATNTPPPSAPIGPAGVVTPVSTPQSGTAIRSGSSDAIDCDPSANLGTETNKNAVAACVQPFRFDPPVHENTGYVVWFDPSGSVTSVERMTQYAAVPRFDACVANALAQVKIPKQKHRCWWRVEYGAPCVPGWFGQCANAAAAASAIPSAVTSAIPIKP